MSEKYPQLSRWLNPRYVQEFEAGTLARRRVEAPFRHAVLTDLFNPAALADILATAAVVPVEKSHRQGLAERADWYWGPFNSLDFMRFLLGKEMRAFLNELIGGQLVMKKTSIPQFNIFRPGSPGLPVHTDFCEEVSYVSLLQLSEGYAPGLGGELVLYRQQGAHVVPEKVIAPVCNTLTIFEVSQTSFHGVNDMAGSWQRRTITYDWLCQARAKILKAAQAGAS